MLIPSNKTPFSLIVGIKADKPQDIGIIAKDARKRNATYIKQKGIISAQDKAEDGGYYKEFVLRFPLSPTTLSLDIRSLSKEASASGKSPITITTIKPELLKTCPVVLSADDRDFIYTLCEQFCENAGTLSAGVNKPHIYRSDSGKFSIDYYKKIINKKTGQPVATPARIGHISGIIEVAQDDFMNYSIPMRMIILLHEYCHKWGNPSLNLPIESETGADIIALSVYLSLGFCAYEAKRAFETVFKGTNTEQNRKRMLIINDFIDKFHKGELTTCNTDYKRINN